MSGFLGGLQSGFGPVGSFVGGIASWIGGKMSSTSGVGQWTGVVLQALSMLHLPSNLLGLILNQMKSESGGNVRAINTTDINAQMGTPSKGLMQVIGPTFEYWRSKLLPDNIYDPLANVFSALNYALHGKGFGTGVGQIGSMHGYAKGGVITEPIIGVGRSGKRYSFGEEGDETVTPGRGGRLGKLADTIVIRESADADLITQRLTWQLQHAGLG
jgi:SLT domain-containing protein